MSTAKVTLSVFATVALLGGCGGGNDGGSKSKPQDQQRPAVSAGSLKTCLQQKGVKVTSGDSPYSADRAIPLKFSQVRIAGVGYWRSDHFAYLYIAERDSGSAEEQVKSAWKGLGGDPNLVRRNGNVIAALDDDKTPTDSELAALNDCA
jgi:hypothetical protein